MALLSPGEVMDPAINQADTYVVMEMASQQTVVVEGQPEMYMPEEEHHIEAGYTPSGELVTSDYRLDPPGDPYTTLVDEPRIMRAVGDVGTLYDVNGQALPAPSDPGYTFTPQQVLNDEGLQVTDGLIVEEIPDDGPEIPAALGMAAAGASLTNVRLTRKGDAFTVSAETIAGNGEPKVRQARTYKRRGSVYVLDEATTDTELEKGGRVALRGQTRLRMRSVRWQNNTGRDAERRGKKGRARGASTSVAEAPPPIPPPPCNPEFEVCGSGWGGGTSPDPCPPLSGTPSLVFQHGIMSNADAWLAGGNGVVLREAKCTFRTGTVVRHSMANSGFNSHASQIAELQADVLANTTGQIVMVGHSQGGIISRRLAQSLQPQGSTPTRQVRGLVTMDTPNSGAIGANAIQSSAMRFSIEALRQFMATPQGGGFVCLPGCAEKVVNLVAGTVGSAGLSWLNPAIWSVDALQGLKPGSPSVTAMNQAYETFPRFAIRSAPSARWMFARLYGDVNGKRLGRVDN